MGGKDREREAGKEKGREGRRERSLIYITGRSISLIQVDCEILGASRQRLDLQSGASSVPATAGVRATSWSAESGRSEDMAE